MSSSSSPPGSKVPPHIRLNSQTENLSAQELSGQGRSLTKPAALSNPYFSSQGQDSTDRLVPPSRTRTNRFRDESPAPPSPSLTAFSSRRSSWESGTTQDSRGFDNPFADSGSRPVSRSNSFDQDLNTQTVSEKYNIIPLASAGLLLYPEDVEKDDELHNPDGDESRDCDIFTKRGLVNVGGLGLITLGLLVLFIGYPALTFIQTFTTNNDPCRNNPNCLNVGKVPLLQNVRSGLIDPDTPKSAYTKKDHHGNEWKLVFSDEFTKSGRTFYDGDDPYMQAVDIWYGVTIDLEWYDPDAVTTNDGVLEIRFDAFQNHNLNYRSGMIQTWNKLCMKGGRLESSLSLPGRGDTVGFWPGLWTLGNLGRPGYAATTEGMWPYSYDDVCDAGITPNQSSSDGINWLPGMRLPACTCKGEDHPTPGKSRSAPEIDVIEATNAPLDGANMIGQVSQSMQVAPFDIWYYPNYEFTEVYDNSITAVNLYRGGPYQQAVSALTNLNNKWYDGQEYQTYAFEYTPGASGDVTWFVGDQATWRVTGQSLGPNGNVGQRVLPEEPMSIIMNFGMSDGFSAINFTGLAPLLPAKMRFDYLRIYQDPNDDNMVMSCDPPGYETTSYINAHKSVYYNQNITSW
ncbi:beta-glucan synthesis-associated protein [Neophaeococcomyces mojaviensis]|uniref:Beta-glucan synthesis-associated protein n=1 Tax=Neophaeococcomyces mojaviensis TaxID=3383035 RepID=A0ACC2ZWD2_9EURO|nr:beta-glucan synthesis-associated protein [Knufia sp. JES_112]